MDLTALVFLIIWTIGITIASLLFRDVHKIRKFLLLSFVIMIIAYQQFIQYLIP